MLYMVSSENVLLHFPVSMNRKELGKCTTHAHNKMPPTPPLVSTIYLNLQSISTAVRPAAHLTILQLRWKTAATQRSQRRTAGKESCERVACKVCVQHVCACCQDGSSTGLSDQRQWFPVPRQVHRPWISQTQCCGQNANWRWSLPVLTEQPRNTTHRIHLSSVQNHWL